MTPKNAVPVAAIKTADFSFEVFDSMALCNKKTKVAVKEISSIANSGSKHSYNGYTFFLFKGYKDLAFNINLFKEKRDFLDNRLNTLPLKRVCGNCKNEFPLTNEFFKKGRKDKYIKNSLSRICKPCESSLNKGYYKTKKLKIASSDHLSSLSLFQRYKKLDKQYKREFGLTLDWISVNITNKKCHYCGYDKQIGIDRIDNKIGHIPNNCLPCCSVCNCARMDNFTVEEFLVVGLAIKEIRLKRENNGS